MMWGADEIVIGESTASQLPGRDFGPADAYRHMLLAAELTRVFGWDQAALSLRVHEMQEDDAADNGMDFWNNDIGMKIGMYVAANGGGARSAPRGRWMSAGRLSPAMTTMRWRCRLWDLSVNWSARSRWRRDQAVLRLGRASADRPVNADIGNWSNRDWAGPNGISRDGVENTAKKWRSDIEREDRPESGVRAKTGQFDIGYWSP